MSFNHRIFVQSDGAWGAWAAIWLRRLGYQVFWIQNCTSQNSLGWFQEEIATYLGVFHSDLTGDDFDVLHPLLEMNRQKRGFCLRLPEVFLEFEDQKYIDWFLLRHSWTVEDWNQSLSQVTRCLSLMIEGAKGEYGEGKKLGDGFLVLQPKPISLSEYLQNQGVLLVDREPDWKREKEVSFFRVKKNRVTLIGQWFQMNLRFENAPQFFSAYPRAFAFWDPSLPKLFLDSPFWVEFLWPVRQAQIYCYLPWEFHEPDRREVLAQWLYRQVMRLFPSVYLNWDGDLKPLPYKRYKESAFQLEWRKGQKSVRRILWDLPDWSLGSRAQWEKKIVETVTRE